MVTTPSSNFKPPTCSVVLSETVNVPVPLVPAENTAISPAVQPPVVAVPALLVLQKLLVSQVPVGAVAVPVAVPLLSQYRSAFAVEAKVHKTNATAASRV